MSVVILLFSHHPNSKMREREKKKENNLKLIIAINHEIIDIINYIFFYFYISTFQIKKVIRRVPEKSQDQTLLSIFNIDKIT